MASVQDSTTLQVNYIPSQSTSKEALDLIEVRKNDDLATHISKSVEVNTSELPAVVKLLHFNCFSVLKNPKTFGKTLLKFCTFLGPGTIISVAYVDPDNFQIALTSGAQFEFRLLVMILLSNLIAIYLQALATKLGCVTGLDLAQMNRAYLPSWLNFFLYFIAEAAIICTDIGQVIGTAIALKLLIPKLPLVGGCALAVADTLFILFFYKTDGSLGDIRIFELFVGVFIIGVFVSFCIELSMITAPVGQVFKGFLPSRQIFVSEGLYQSCAILGGTLMPHALYLGSGLVQARMRDFDRSHSTYHDALPSHNSKYAMPIYRPTLSAIASCMSWSIAELCITLFIVTIFVNSAILIVAASRFYPNSIEATLPGMYELFVNTIGHASGTIFALSLLFSGLSSGIVATMAGQLVCEGAMNWRIHPFLRRLVTRCIACIPALIIAASTGQEGLAAALNACNVVLSVALIFLTLPLICYTSCHRYMRVNVDDTRESVGVVDGILSYEVSRSLGRREEGTMTLANNWGTTVVAFFIWGVLVALNVATLTLLGLGIGGED
ncbi:hypothetical protein HYALB_00004597 [Hymenoscyphus albidus]|uniref:Natural resistance-associated macrophage protein n=1 Tax=Hymenoscyphus albidus TaxID=595503 RepID=A0A9N9Q2N3_9HELO|nr:hypothetical protein HYALB_00004597 [Hymenoscyphus albidus]